MKLPIYLTDEDFKKLHELGRKEIRDPKQQAAWLIREGRYE